MQNLNTGFYEDLNTNFEQAFIMATQNFSHEELINMLRNGNIPEKQIAALKIETLDSEEETTVLISNLTGCDGKIREAVALKINKLLNSSELKYKKYFSEFPEIFADATIDINGNICRLVIDSVYYLKSSSEFSQIYLNKIFEFINDSFKELDNFIFRDKKYVINKQLFKLYWCLEALKLFVDTIDSVKLLEILTRASQEKEYTIREKIAQILVLKPSKEFYSLAEDLKSDENYYVRQVFLNHPSIFN